MIKGDELVVVDYKTGVKSEKDLTQVRGYLKDFSKMGYPNPKGFLWYISNDEIIEV